MQIMGRRLRLSHLKVALGVSLFVGFLKIFFQYWGIEVFEVNPLLTAIISGNIFLLGFLLNSTLRDYKEAEKIPAEMANALETIYDECEIILRKKKIKVVIELVRELIVDADKLREWFYKRAYTQDVLMRISMLNSYFGKLEPLTQANFIVRMKNEQNRLRGLLIKANILRDTPFYETSYNIAKISVVALMILLSLLSADPFYEYLFFILVIVFINMFLVLLIKDLDDPYEYEDADLSDEVSLKPFDDFEKRVLMKTRELKIKLLDS